MDPDLKKRLLWIHMPAVPITALLAGYIVYTVIVFTISGTYIFHTRINLGHPISISFVESPLLFLGLCFVQLSIAALLAGWATESAYHTLRILKPFLGWPLRPTFKPFKSAVVLLVVGAALVALNVFYMVTVMLLHK